MGIQLSTIKRGRRRRQVPGQEGVEDITRRLSTSKIEEETSSQCWYWCDDFTEEILSRLTADHLKILKTVCKNWLRIISTPYFVRLHLNNAYQSHIRVLAISWRFSVMNIYNINCDDDNVETKKQVHFQPPIRSMGEFKILGSCDGLLCLFLTKPNQFGVYNPSTGKYFLVQSSPKYNYTCFWFGRHPSSGDYVLVLWDLDWKVGVYKFKSATLESIHSAPCFIHLPYPIPDIAFSSFEERGTLLHGALHWPALWCNRRDYRCRRVICMYHLDHNKYSEISPPDSIYEFKLGVNTEGCLFAIFNDLKDKLGVEMWVMKEYGVEQSWAKQANIVRPYEYMALLSPLGSFPNGDLILDADKFGLVKYSFNDNKVVFLIKHQVCCRYAFVGIVCVDSLVSPTIVLSVEETNS